MKPGTSIPGLDFLELTKGSGDNNANIVAKERSEYPSWIETLSIPLSTLGKLQKMPQEDANEKDMMRYLKLTRRLEIKNCNEEKTA